MLHNKKILITGAGGFIGSHLWQYISQHDNQVIACLNRPTERQFSAKDRAYVMSLPSQDFALLLEQEKPDYLIHCAGTASVAKSFANPEKDFFNNVVVTEFIFESLAKYSSATKTLFLSSAAVYGQPEKLPIDAQTKLNPISPYGYHKLFGEMICEKYHRLFNIPVSIARIFSVYGPGLKKQLLWDIYQKSFHTNSIILGGSGEETRDFICISDLVKVIDSLLEYSAFDADKINIATGQNTTIRKLAELMLEKMGSQASVQFNNQSRMGDPSYWQIDKNTVSKFGGEGYLSLEEGIESYIAWLRSEELKG